MRLEHVQDARGNHLWRIGDGELDIPVPEMSEKELNELIHAVSNLLQTCSTYQRHLKFVRDTRDTETMR